MMGTKHPVLDVQLLSVLYHRWAHIEVAYPYYFIRLRSLLRFEPTTRSQAGIHIECF